MAKITFIEENPAEGKAATREPIRTFQIHSHAATVSHRSTKRHQAQQQQAKKDGQHLRVVDSNRCMGSCENILELNKAQERCHYNYGSERRGCKEDGDVDEITASSAKGVLKGTMRTKKATSKVFRVSPHSGISMQYSATSLRHCEYFATAMAPVQAAVDDLFAVNSVYTRPMVPRMLSAEDRGFAGISALNAASHLRHSNGECPIQVHKSIDKAISGRRQHLEGLNRQPDDIVILVHLQLTTAFEAMGELETVTNLKRNLKHLVDAAGGINGPGLSTVLSYMVLQWDFCSAINLAQPPIFEVDGAVGPEYYPQPPFNRQIESLVKDLPHGFKRLAMQSRLSQDVLNLLSRVTRLSFDEAQQISADNQPPPFADKPDHFASYLRAFPCLCYPDDKCGRPNLEKLIVLSVILYLFHFFGAYKATYGPYRVFSGLYRAARRRVTIDIRRRPAYLAEERGVLLWCCVNVVDAWQPRKVLLNRQAPPDLISKAHQAFPEISSRKVLRSRLQEFFWDDAFLRRSESFWCLGRD